MNLLGKTLTEEQERMVLAWFITGGKEWDLWQPDSDPALFDAEQQAYLRRIQDVVERSGMTTFTQAEYMLNLEMTIMDLRR